MEEYLRNPLIKDIEYLD